MMNKLEHIYDVVRECSRLSESGKVHFGQIVARLVAAGVESYHADYRRGEKTYYLPDGSSHIVPMTIERGEVGGAFDKEAVIAAIRGAQVDAVRYPEFVTRTVAAGCVGYMVWIAGRQASYFGRRGELHIEHFPGAS
jgi:uncharacterized protein YbcV (DUF1398 family)